MSDELIESAARAYHAQVAILRALQLEMDTKQAEVVSLRTKIAAEQVQLKDKRNALKAALNAN